MRASWRGEEGSAHSFKATESARFAIGPQTAPERASNKSDRVERNPKVAPAVAFHPR